MHRALLLSARDGIGESGIYPFFSFIISYKIVSPGCGNSEREWSLLLIIMATSRMMKRRVVCNLHIMASEYYPVLPHSSTWTVPKSSQTPAGNGRHAEKEPGVLHKITAIPTIEEIEKLLLNSSSFFTVLYSYAFLTSTYPSPPPLKYESPTA